MKELIVMVGLPGCGKSTYIDNMEFRSLIDDSFEDTYVILSTDDYIETKAKERNSTYSLVFEEYIKEAEANLKSRLKEAVDNGHGIIWDQTNLRRKKRATILNSVPKNYKKIAVEFIVPTDVILERIKKRGEETGKYIPNHVIKSMEESKENVTDDEGFDRIVHVRYTQPES